MCISPLEFRSTLSLLSCHADPGHAACAQPSEGSKGMGRYTPETRAVLWFARWANVRDEAAFVAAFSSLSGWRDSAPDAVLPALMRKPERLRLLPTAGSALR
jgi:hypothetical protein